MLVKLSVYVFRDAFYKTTSEHSCSSETIAVVYHCWWCYLLCLLESEESRFVAIASNGFKLLVLSWVATSLCVLESWQQLSTEIYSCHNEFLNVSFWGITNTQIHLWIWIQNHNCLKIFIFKLFQHEIDVKASFFCFYCEKNSRLEGFFLRALPSSFSCENKILRIYFSDLGTILQKWKHNCHKIAECECQHLLIFTNFKMCYEMPTTSILHNTEMIRSSLFFTCVFIRSSLVSYVLVLHLCCWERVSCLNDRVKLVFGILWYFSFRKQPLKFFCFDTVSKTDFEQVKGREMGGAQNLNCIFELFSFLNGISVLEIITWSHFD